MANERKTRRYVRKGMTVTALADWLGVDVQVLRRLVKAGLLVAHRITGRTLVVTAAEINRFLADTSTLRRE